MRPRNICFRERFSISHGVNLLLANAVFRQQLARRSSQELGRVMLELRLGAGTTQFLMRNQPSRDTPTSTTRLVVSYSGRGRRRDATLAQTLLDRRIQVHTNSRAGERVFRNGEKPARITSPGDWSSHSFLTSRSLEGRLDILELSRRSISRLPRPQASLV
jgi:hypothetical protein